MAEKSQKSFCKPILRILREMGGAAHRKEVVRHIVEERKFTDADMTEGTSSGKPKIEHKIAWAKQSLVTAGYLSGTSPRGIWQLTQKGLEVDLDAFDPDQFVREVNDINRKRKQQQAQTEFETETVELPEDDSELPGEQYRAQLLDILRKLDPAQFEKICGRLLTEIGFEDVEITQRSHDDGIDGIGLVKVNALVKIPVLFQFKRYAGTVGPNAVRDFRGTMQGRAENGAIITTGTFTLAAGKEATREGVSTIDLVDGDALVDLFVEHKLGVTPVETYEVDEAFFDRFRD